MKRSLFALFLAATLPAAALAAPPALGTRPIARAEVIAAVKAQFAAMDANRDGTVSRAEFDAYRARQAPSDEGDPFRHVGGHWFDHADAAGDGRVTLAEAEARPLQMFDMADINHDGVLGIDEQKMAAMMMGLHGR